MPKFEFNHCLMCENWKYRASSDQYLCGLCRITEKETKDFDSCEKFSSKIAAQRIRETMERA